MDPRSKIQDFQKTFLGSMVEILDPAMLVYQRVLLEIFWMARFPPQSPKKNLVRRLNKRVVGKKKQISPFCWTSRFQEEHPHFQVNNGDFSIASDFSGWFFSPFLYPVPSRSIPFLHLSHPKMHHLTVFFFGLIIMGCPISEQRHFKHFQNS